MFKQALREPGFNGPDTNEAVVEDLHNESVEMSIAAGTVDSGNNAVLTPYMVVSGVLLITNPSDIALSIDDTMFPAESLQENIMYVVTVIGATRGMNLTWSAGVTLITDQSGATPTQFSMQKLEYSTFRILKSGSNFYLMLTEKL